MLRLRVRLLEDAPVTYQFGTLVAAYPRAAVVLTVRDPWDWRASRIATHLGHDGRASLARQAVPCGGALDHAYDDERLTVLDYVVNACWAACVAARRGMPLHVVGIVGGDAGRAEVELRRLFGSHIPERLVRPATRTANGSLSQASFQRASERCQQQHAHAADPIDTEAAVLTSRPTS